MEITPSPHRPAPTSLGRLLALVIVLGPVSILVLLPIGLGLERYVVSGDSMDGGDQGISQGTVLFERMVPVNELRVGDVVTYRPPEEAGVDGMVTHRVVALRPAGVVTQGDAEPLPDAWLLAADAPDVSRMVFRLPWLGYAYLVVADPAAWAVVIVCAGALAFLLSGELKRRRGAVPAAEKVLATEVSDEQ